MSKQLNRSLKLGTILIISIILTLGFSISLQSLLAAWTAPSANPPTNNIADLNLGGGLSVATNALVVGNFSTMGNVGIGTTSPMAKLDVAGDVLVNGLTIGKGGGNYYYNTAVGVNALKSNITGSSNTANGDSALLSNNGSDNTAIGSNALRSNIGGNYNTANGSAALYSNTTGSFNTANGSLALLFNTTGNYNTANGTNALQRNTTGSYNTASGLRALLYNTTGYNNTANGADTLYSNTTGTNNTANGLDALYLNTTGYNNTAIGGVALYSNTVGYNNTAIGTNADSHITTGNNNIAIGYNAQVPSNTGSNQVRIGDTAITYAGIQVPWTITSDRRLKDDIQNVPLGLDFINTLHPVDYFRKNDASKKRETGLIAQEVDEVLKKFGYENAGMLTKDDNGYYSLRYNDFIAPIIKSIQEISTTTDSMAERIEKLENENKSLVELVCLDHPNAKICQ